MFIRNLQILNKQKTNYLPDWVVFAFELGSFLYDHGIKYRKPINILLSLPSEKYFSLLIAMGIADKTFSVNKQMRSIKKQVMSLKKGSRIIYQDEDASRKVSVLSVEPSPVFDNEMILWIKDKNMRRAVPEKQWIDRLILLDEESDEIKRSRKVSEKKELGLEGSAILSELYSQAQLSKVSFYPGDYFYLVGNTSQINDQMNEDIFIYNSVKGNIKDFLYMDDKNSYTNGKLFSSQLKKKQVEIAMDVPVIYSDVNSYIKQSRYFSTNPNVIVLSRTDNESRIHEVIEEMKRKLLQEEYNVLTHELIDFLISSNTKIPKGIELFVWR
ncbi:uncharacterized protein (UPF0303 family) [Gracilibacillus halotolerans]|uniref:Uncharacterized protein (UPF0303 family) n=1 Tax=Gracilibacillus halotolerans TaxID=74386 RepID=A0A841RH73_9BACI|nr:hypothetical protein [Gracilibacillus halotolerans]MBB6512001.1 uncharacterized protein (UPF0303 family) [Gracilibacillus halotolerans]